MRISEQRSRWIRIGYVVLLLVSAAQVGWWVLDQWLFTEQVNALVAELQQGNVRAAEELLRRGLEPGRLASLVPGVLPGPDGGAIADAELMAALNDERVHRLNRYGWEGGFFMLVLIGGVSVLARAVRDESLLRRRQESFLAAVSHELKSPLATARLAAETLQLRDPPVQERRRLIERLLRNLNRLERMVTNLLDAARLEQSTLAAQREELEIAGVLHGVLETFSERALEKGINFVQDIPARLRIRGDAEATRTIVRNLLENALTAVAAAELPEVRVNAGVSGDRVDISVSDNGVGFVPAEGRRLFEKFYRPGDEMHRGGSGAGLGLFIVRELAGRMGATVAAESQGPGRGACFRVSWPRILGDPA